MPNTVLNYATVRPTKLAEWIGTFVKLPVFDYSNIVWKDASEAIIQFNYSASKNFTIKFLPKPPKNPTFCPVIRYRVGETVYRYKLWEAVGEVLHEALYSGQIIKKNFVIEIYNIADSARIVSEKEIKIKLSIRNAPSSYISLDDTVDASELLLTPENLLPISSFPSSIPSTGLAFHYKVDDLNLGFVSQWDDRSGNGLHLIQNNFANQPRINEDEFNGGRFQTLDFSSSKFLSRTGISINLDVLYIVLAQSSWALTRSILRLRELGIDISTITQASLDKQIQINSSAIPGTIEFDAPLKSDSILDNIFLLRLIYDADDLFKALNDSPFLASIDIGLYAKLDLLTVNLSSVLFGYGDELIIGGTSNNSADMSIFEIAGYYGGGGATPFTPEMDLQLIQYFAGKYNPSAIMLPLQFNENVSWLDND